MPGHVPEYFCGGRIDTNSCDYLQRLVSVLTNKIFAILSILRSRNDESTFRDNWASSGSGFHMKWV